MSGSHRARLVMTVALGLVSGSAFALDRPNILLIVSDNQHAGLLGAYGNPDIRTPSIDRLADEGVTFTRAFAVNGMCSPTRATLMTGLMPSQHGLHDWLNDEQMEDWPRDWSAVAEFRSLPYTLKENGYQTAMIGKWHLGQPWEASLGFDYWITFTSGHTLDFWRNDVVDNGDVIRVEGQHMVDYFGDRAVAYIDNVNADDPFFLNVSFDGPYMDPPTNMGPARNRHYQSYVDQPLSSFPQEPFNANYVDQLIDFARSNDSDHFLNRMIKTVLTRMAGDHASRANMASQNTLVDDNVGRLLDALERRDLNDNTIVIYSSDQGTYYGQNGLWTHTVMSSPSTLQETAFQIPLIIRSPEGLKDHREPALIGQYDIPVTILEMAGIDTPLPNSPGRSFKGLINDADSPSVHDAVFYEQTETRGIRTDRYAYWKRLDSDFGGNELYDMRADPEQRRNIVADATLNDVVQDLDARLTAFFDEYTSPRYDLWSGGTAKGSLSHPDEFRRRYGDNWAIQTTILPSFGGAP
ncbi:sulfatase family protein [Halomonas sp. V046]|uniref:sulfatase family protein n=1 Tax=Halomonas sp. V046 TaxID=3459611 RepID=UPI004044093B